MLKLKAIELENEIEKTDKINSPTEARGHVQHLERNSQKENNFYKLAEALQIMWNEVDKVFKATITVFGQNVGKIIDKELYQEAN